MRVAEVVRGGSEDHYQRLLTLVEVSRLLSAELDLKEIIHRVLTHAIRVIPGADAGVLYIHDPATDTLRVMDAIGFGPSIFNVVLKPGEGAAGQAYQTGQSFIYRDLRAIRAVVHIANKEAREEFRRAGRQSPLPRSGLVAPLQYRSQSLGALVVDNLAREDAFDTFDQTVLGHLAAVVAVAIINARLYEAERAGRVRMEILNAEVTRQRDELDRRIKVQDAVAQVAREGLVLNALAHRLAEICNGRVMILDTLGRIRASAPEATQFAFTDLGLPDVEAGRKLMDRIGRTRVKQAIVTPDGQNFLISAVHGRSAVLGFVIMSTGERAPDQADDAAIDSATLVAVADFLHETSIEERDSRQQANVLDRLLRGEVPAGLRTSRSLVPPIVLATGQVEKREQPAVTGDATQLDMLRVLAREAVGRLANPAAVTVREPHVVVAVSILSTEDRTDVATRLLSVSTDFRRVSPHWGVRFALSEPINDVETLPEAYEESRLALESRQQTDHPDSVFDVPNLGPFRLLVRAARGKESVEMARKVLEPILRHETTHGDKLLPTFRAYVVANGGLTQTARNLKVHIHTVQQRLRRIEQLTNLNLHRSADRMTLEFALQIVDLGGDQSTRSQGLHGD